MTRTEWWPCIERVEDKAPARARIAGDVEAFLAQGGQIESAVSLTLRCVQSTDSHARTRVVWAPEMSRLLEAEARKPLTKNSRPVLPVGYGRNYRKKGAPR